MIVYIDTSAALKLAVPEPESAALVHELNSDKTRRPVSSRLLYAELHCAAERHPTRTDPQEIDDVLDNILLVNLQQRDLTNAARLEGLRTCDAIHLATAIRLNADQMIAFNMELLAAARRHGMIALNPGAA